MKENKILKEYFHLKRREIFVKSKLAILDTEFKEIKNRIQELEQIEEIKEFKKKVEALK